MVRKAEWIAKAFLILHQIFLQAFTQERFTNNKKPAVF